MIINEFMYDPLTGQNEWIEFFNRSNETIDLAGWRFSDRPTTGGSVNTFIMTAQSHTIRPGDFVVAAAESTIFSRFPLLRAPASTRHLFILNRSGGLSFGNDGDAIILRDQSGLAIDTVSYSPNWHHPDVTDSKGRSLERINQEIGSNDRRNWSTSAAFSGGTPGERNSLHTTGLSSNASLSFNPNPFSPDGDGFEDFCIIRYNLPLTTSLIRITIFDRRGRNVKTLANSELAGPTGEVIWDGLDTQKQRVRIGPYIVFLEAIDGQGGIVAAAKGVVVVATKL
ncbi:MAG: lamin tail domain-containing protein, partial [Bacteroidota bacterium]